MNLHLTHEVARVFRQEHPEMCDIIDRLIRAGQTPEAVERVVRQQCRAGSIIPGLANVYLRDVDPDFRRREEQRQWAREGALR